MQWEVRENPTSHHWIAVCEPLKLALEAPTLDELRGLIDETIHLLLTDLFEDNELDRFLREHGWRAPDLPAAAPAEEIQFDIPWEMMVKQGGQSDSPRRAH
jgi:hypothetical protein